MNESTANRRCRVFSEQGETVKDYTRQAWSYQGDEVCDDTFTFHDTVETHQGFSAQKFLYSSSSD